MKLQKMMNLLIIFSHFDIDNIIDDYVIYYIKKLHVYSDIIFVSTSDLPEIEQEKVRNYSIKVMCRKNEGYDFYSYKMGFLDSGIDISSYNWIGFANDSVYAPLFDLEFFFQFSSQTNADYIGITENKEISNHIQSYFMIFKDSIVNKRFLHEFFQNVNIIENKSDIINKYEIGLNKFLLKNNFRYEAFFSPKSFCMYINIFVMHMKHHIKPEINKKDSILHGIIRFAARFIRIFIKYFSQIMIHKKVNFTHFAWKKMLRNKIPIIKIELLRTNPWDIECADDIVKYIHLNSNYPIELIQKHLKRTSERYKK